MKHARQKRQSDTRIRVEASSIPWIRPWISRLRTAKKTSVFKKICKENIGYIHPTIKCAKIKKEVLPRTRSTLT